MVDRVDSKTIFVITVLILLGPGADTGAAATSAIPGAFADIGLDARAMGMGGAASAGTGRVADLVWNPAGLAYLEALEVSAMQTEQFDIVPTYFVAVGLPDLLRLPLAAGLISSGDALLRENTLLLGAGLSPVVLRGIALGAVLKLRRASFGSGGTQDCVEGSAMGLAVDLGLSGALGPVSFGLVLEEALGRLDWNSSVKGKYSESIPHTLSGGLEFHTGPFSFAGDLEIGLHDERADKFAAGLEYSVHPILQIRGGLKQRLVAEEARFLTMGFGLGHTLPGGQRLQLDMAYLFHDLGNSLRISAGYIFP